MVRHTSIEGGSSEDPGVAAAGGSLLVDQLARLGQPRRYPARTLLIQEGDVGDCVYLVLQGRLRVFLSDRRGKEVTLGIYGAGEYVGEMALDGGRRSANVETIEPTLCSVVSNAILRGHLADHPQFAVEMMTHLIRRARQATDSARRLALIDVYGRLRTLLEELAGEPQRDGSRQIAQRLTHRELASRVVCSREMISRLLRDLQQGGYLSSVEKRLVLHKALPARW